MYLSISIHLCVSLTRAHTLTLSHILRLPRQSFLFNDETDVLVGLADGRMNVWHNPAVPFIDKDMMPLTLTSVDANEYGRNAQIVAFTGNRSTFFFGWPYEHSS